MSIISSDSTPYRGRVETLSFYSPTLKLDWNYSVYLPEGFDTDQERSFPMLYLLHGAYGHQLNLIQQFSTPAMLDRLIESGVLPEVVAVFVDGFNSFYIDGPAFQMESAILQDLIPFMETRYRGQKTRSGRMIGGLSMGGYGAARLVLGHPELFCAGLLLSPAVWYTVQGQQPRLNWGLFDGFSQRVWDGYHPATNLSAYAAKGCPAAFFVYHGAEDLAVPEKDVTRFVNELSRVAPVEYHCIPGRGHEWPFWEEGLEAALHFAGGLLQRG